MTVYGYARVSTRDQDLIAQDAELMAAGCAKVFKEKISGAKTDRPELAKVIRRLEPGDVLLVTRLDRLARSTRDLLNVLAAVGERGAGFKSLKDAWADTTTAHGRLMLTVLGGLAEFERELIMARTGEGRLRAKARGVRFGRPRTLTPHQRQEAMQRLAEGEVQADLARSYGVSQSTISRLSGDRPFEAARPPPSEAVRAGRARLLSFCGQAPSTRRRTSRRRMAALRDWEFAIASNAATRTVPRFRPALPSRGNRISVVSLEEAQRSAAAAVYASPA